MNSKILIIGGTGMLGLPVARRLKEDGFEVTILTTNPEAARARLGSAFELVRGDVTDGESLREPMAGMDFVYLSLNSQLDKRLYEQIEIGGTANAARIAAESGVKRIGMISGASSHGKEEGVIYLDAKVKAEKAVIDSGVPYTVMRPSWFFESLPGFVQGGRAGVLGKQPHLRGWLAAEDYAVQVSRAFRTDEAANKCFYNLGPEPLTVMEAVEQFCARFYPELTPKSVPFAMASMMAALPGKERLRKAIPFFKYFDTRPEDCPTAEADRILGPNLTTLEEWMDRYKKPEASD
jgi:uncharacterized protein YbjT (DUF2867 family)